MKLEVTDMGELKAQVDTAEQHLRNLMSEADRLNIWLEYCKRCEEPDAPKIVALQSRAELHQMVIAAARHEFNRACIEYIHHGHN